MAALSVFMRVCEPDTQNEASGFASKTSAQCDSSPKCHFQTRQVYRQNRLNPLTKSNVHLITIPFLRQRQDSCITVATRCSWIEERSNCPPSTRISPVDTNPKLKVLLQYIYRFLPLCPTRDHSVKSMTATKRRKRRNANEKFEGI